MKKKTALAAACVEAPTTSTGTLVPVPATIIVVVVILLTAALTIYGMPVETVITVLAVGGLLAIELIRRLVDTLTAARRQAS
ncbi:hypothetical protein ACFVX6_12310 [Streptomyces sp. NPDC058289]|uniref:hypothetical protein n=1 Tax=Streptomyces sp. NPDC058289 TaxID=3346425 RepID=UPI0036E9BDFC